MLSRLSQNTAPPPGNTARLSHSSADSCKLGAATKSGGQLNQKVGRRASGAAVFFFLVFFLLFFREQERKEGWKEESRGMGGGGAK